MSEEKIYDIIENLDLREAQVEKEELDRILKKSIKAVDIKIKETKKSGVRWIFKTAVSIAACLLILFGINIVNPVFAEGIPIIGSVFSLMNKGDKDIKTHLPAEDNATYAKTPDPDDNLLFKSKDYTLELNEIYSDELYLRITSTITGDFDYSWINTADDNFNAYSVKVKETGKELFIPVNPSWRSVGDGRYVAEITCVLDEETAKLDSFTAEVFISDLVGVRNEHDENGEYLTKDLGDDEYTITLGVTKTKDIRRGSAADAEKGIENVQVIATPGETRVKFKSKLENGNVVILARDENGEKLEGFGGMEKEENGYNVGYMDYGALSKESKVINLTFFDKNADETRAEFSIEMTNSGENDNYS